MLETKPQEIIAQIQAAHTICKGAEAAMIKRRNDIMALTAAIKIAEENAQRIQENIQRYTEIYQELDDDEKSFANDPEELAFFQVTSLEIETLANTTRRNITHYMTNPNDTENEAIIQWHQNHLYVEYAAQAADRIATAGLNNSTTRERRAIRQEILVMVQKAEAALGEITDNPPQVIARRQHRFRSMLNDTKDHIHRMRRNAESIPEETL